MKWHELDAKAQRKACILGALVVAAMIVLAWPADMVPWHSPTRPPARQVSKPSPVVHAVGPASPVSPRTPPAPPDPQGQLLGKWQGAESLPNRGLCSLALEVRPGRDGQGFSAFSTLGCMGNVLPGSAKDPVGLAETVRRGINPTSASFSGTAQEGGIVLHALENVGVREALQGCDMVSMTLKAFGEGRMSVKWQDTGKDLCAGGEMLLGRAH